MGTWVGGGDGGVGVGSVVQVGGSGIEGWWEPRLTRWTRWRRGVGVGVAGGTSVDVCIYMDYV